MVVVMELACLLFSLPDLLTEEAGGVGVELVGINKGSLGGTGDGKAPLSEAMEAAKGFMKGAPVAADMVANWLIHC